MVATPLFSDKAAAKVEHQRAHISALLLLATDGCLPDGFRRVVFVFTIVTLHSFCNFFSGKRAVMLRTATHRLLDWRCPVCFP